MRVVKNVIFLFIVDDQLGALSDHRIKEAIGQIFWMMKPVLLLLAFTTLAVAKLYRSEGGPQAGFPIIGDYDADLGLFDSGSDSELELELEPELEPEVGSSDSEEFEVDPLLDPDNRDDYA